MEALPCHPQKYREREQSEAERWAVRESPSPSVCQEGRHDSWKAENLDPLFECSAQRLNKRAADLWEERHSGTT